MSESGDFATVPLRRPTAVNETAELDEVLEVLSDLRTVLTSTTRAHATLSGRVDDVDRRMESLERTLDEVLEEVRGLRSDLSETRPELAELLAFIRIIRPDTPGTGEVTDGNH